MAHASSRYATFRGEFPHRRRKIYLVARWAISCRVFVVILRGEGQSGEAASPLFWKPSLSCGSDDQDGATSAVRWN